VAIGQGQVSVTPIALASLYAAVGNGGIHYPPRLLKATDDGSGWKDAEPPASQASGSSRKPSPRSMTGCGWW